MPIDQKRLAQLLARVQAGEVTISEALERLRLLPYEDLGFAKVDHHRPLRKGFPEVVLGLGKTPEQVASIAQRLAAQGGPVLITKASPEAFERVQEQLPQASYNALARTIVLNPGAEPLPHSGILVLAAGTADLPVAEEAAVTAEVMGQAPERVYDVGIAGLHRLLDQLPQLHQAQVVIAVAGMEGALPSVVAGLVAVPVIAVPTSTGYGTSFQGLAALLAMLNACAPGVAVVNIDNGFGAGYLASMIVRPQKASPA